MKIQIRDFYLPMYRDIAQFTIPCITELFLFSLITVVNMAMVGRLGSVALTAVGLSNQPVRISIALFQAFNIGATAMIARFTGSKDYDNARKVIMQTMQVSIILGCIISIPVFFYAESIVLFMGAKSESVYHATVYMKFMASGTVFQVISLAVSSLLRGAGDSKNPMYINIFANILNLVFGYILIFGWGCFPALGVFGAGLSATAAKFFSSVLAVILLFKTKLPVRLGKSIKLGFDWPIIKGISGIGSASAIEQIVLRGGFFLYTRMIADLGTVAFAAHQICLTISNLSTNLGQALGMASSSFTGRNIGAGKPGKAVIYVRTLHRIALVLSIIISIGFILTGQNLISIFTTEKSIIEYLFPLLIILAIINPAQNTFLVYSGSLKGAGETRWPLLVSIIGLIFIRLPLVFYTMKYLEWGLTGAWIATALEKYISYFILTFIFRKGSWKKIKIASL